MEKEILIIKEKIKHLPKVAIITGSGIDIKSIVENAITVSYQELGMQKNKVAGHSGEFVFGTIDGVKVVVANRYHYYEMGDIEQVRLPYQILNEIGIKNIILQTSCAGINTAYNVGDIINIKDHINFTGTNPLMGLSPIKFVNMSNCYDNSLRNKIKDIYNELNLEYKDGVHIQFNGPNYETKAELELCKILNVDTISMSMVYDNLLANYFDMKVCAFGVVSNVVNNESIKSLSHIEVLSNAKLANTNFLNIVKLLVKQM